MKIINSYLGFAIVQNGELYSVMSRRNPSECRSFNNLKDAQAYFDTLTEPFTRAQANAPSWD